MQLFTLLVPAVLVSDSFSATFRPTRDGARHSEALEALSKQAAHPRKTAQDCGLTHTVGTAPHTMLPVTLTGLGCCCWEGWWSQVVLRGDGK